MRAIVFHGKGDIRLEEVKVPKCGPTDVQVSVSESSFIARAVIILE